MVYDLYDIFFPPFLDPKTTVEIDDASGRTTYSFIYTNDDGWELTDKTMFVSFDILHSPSEPTV